MYAGQQFEAAVHLTVCCIKDRVKWVQLYTQYIQQGDPTEKADTHTTRQFANCAHFVKASQAGATQYVLRFGQNRTGCIEMGGGGGLGKANRM
jgi:hypothetical protein